MEQAVHIRTTAALRAKLRNTWLRDLVVRYRDAKRRVMRRSEGEAFLLRRYSRVHGKPLNLTNPQTFTEKLFWRMVMWNRGDMHPRFRRLADKYAVRAHVASTVGEEYLIPLLWQGDDPRAGQCRVSRIFRHGRRIRPDHGGDPGAGGGRAPRADRFPGPVRSAATGVMKCVEDFMIASFGMSGYKGFEAGKNGVFVVLPSGRTNCWKHYRWYTPIRGDRDNYGSWSFLKDGATPDDAFERVYGLDALGIENAWRASVGLDPRAASPTAAPRPDDDEPTPRAGTGAPDAGDDEGDGGGAPVGAMIIIGLLAIGVVGAGFMAVRVARARF